MRFSFITAACVFVQNVQKQNENHVCLGLFNGAQKTMRQKHKTKRPPYIVDLQYLCSDINRT
jgi:hypothetical protein